MPEILSTIFLIGPRGAGKSSVGKALAKALGYDFHDTDDLICDEAGLNVAEIVAREGWTGFRQREERALAAAAKQACVVATGGGMVLAEANRSFMRSVGTVFFLSAPPEILRARLGGSGQAEQRPPLTDKGLQEEIETILTERAPLYRATAHHCLDASAPLPKVVDLILRILRGAFQEG